jgi:hypothetical protein
MSGVAGAALVAVLAGCGASDAGTSPPGAAATTASSAPSASAALCTSAQQLQASVQSLTHLDVSTAGADGLKTSVQQVSTDLQAFIATVGNEFRPTIAALRVSLGALSTTASQVTDKETLGSAAPQLAVQMSAVSASWAALKQNLTGRCP